jgi:hypothetical protein
LPINKPKAKRGIINQPTVSDTQPSILGFFKSATCNNNIKHPEVISNEAAQRDHEVETEYGGNESASMIELKEPKKTYTWTRQSRKK